MMSGTDIERDRQTKRERERSGRCGDHLLVP